MPNWNLLLSDPMLVTPWITVHKNRYRTEANEYIDDYYIVERNDFALIVATYQAKLLLVRQYRPATNREYIALPAGYLDQGEDPMDCARRELPEETGYSATNCKLIGELHPLPGYIKSKAYVITCEAVPAPNQQVDKLEINDTLMMSWAEVLDKIVSGEIIEMQAVSAILLAKELANAIRDQ